MDSKRYTEVAALMLKGRVYATQDDLLIDGTSLNEDDRFTGHKIHRKRENPGCDYGGREMKLYELAEQYNALLEMDDLPEDALADTLEAIGGEFEDKADGIACVIKEAKAVSGAIKAEMDKLDARRKAKEALAKRLSEYLLTQMQAVGMQKLETGRSCVSVAKKAPALKIDDENAFIAWAAIGHDEYIKYRSPEVDKTAVRDALKAGTEIPGARLEGGYRLAVK